MLYFVTQVNKNSKSLCQDKIYTLILLQQSTEKILFYDYP